MAHGPAAGTARLLSAAQNGRGLGPRMQHKAEALLRRYRYDGGDQLQPVLLEAEKLLDGMVQEVCAATGECGPIARSALHTAALQKALGVFFVSTAAKQAPTERSAIGLYRAGSALLDCSRQNSLAALETAVRIARTAKASEGDVLDAYMAPEQPDTDE